MPNASQILTPRQIKGLNKVGDAFIPGDDDLPRFSATGAAGHADRILAYLKDQDKGDLKTALTVMSFLPVTVVVWLIRFLEKTHNAPGSIGALIRMGHIGLKGLVVSLYYSGETGAGYTGPTTSDVIGFHVSVYLEDLRD